MFRFNQIRSNEPQTPQSGDSENTESTKSSPLSGMGSKPQAPLGKGGSSPFSAQSPGKSGSPFSAALGTGSSSSALKKADPSSSSINTGVPKVPQPTGNSTPANSPFISTPPEQKDPILEEVKEREVENLEISVPKEEPADITPSVSSPVTEVKKPSFVPQKMTFGSLKSSTPPVTTPIVEKQPEVEKTPEIIPPELAVTTPVVSEFIEDPIPSIPEPVIAKEAEEVPVSKPEPEVVIAPAVVPVVAPVVPKVSTPAPVAANKLNFSPPVMGGQDQIDHIRLEIYHEIIRACGTLKKISRAEATSLINITSKAPDGLILPHVSKMISIPPDALQADLLSKDNLNFAPINFFANVLKTSKFEKSRRLLIPYGIIPLFSKDAVITCGMELPHLRDVVLEISNRHSLGFKWCHAIIFKIKDLQDAISAG